MSDSDEEEGVIKMQKHIEYRPKRKDWCYEWPIHRWFLKYTLEDVALESNRDTLLEWQKLFTHPPPLCTDEELFYARMMLKVIHEKLDMLSK